MGHRVFEFEGRIYALGGRDEKDNKFPMDHFSVFDLQTSTCSIQQIRGDEIPTRQGFSIGLIGHKLYIFGGMEENRRCLKNDLFVVDLKSFDCEKLDPGTELPSRRSHCIDWVWEKKLFVLGGWSRLRYAIFCVILLTTNDLARVFVVIVVS